MEKRQIPIEELLPASGDSVYKLVILVAKRAIGLADGEKPLVDKPSEKFLENALEEIAAGKIKMKG